MGRRALDRLRESPKFTKISVMGVAREALLDSGRELVEKGVLKGADDLFYLSMRELKTLAIGAPGNWNEAGQWALNCRTQRTSRAWTRPPLACRPATEFVSTEAVELSRYWTDSAGTAAGRRLATVYRVNTTEYLPQSFDYLCRQRGSQ